MRAPAAAMLNLLGTGRWVSPPYSLRTFERMNSSASLYTVLAPLSCSSADDTDALRDVFARALSTPGATPHWYGKGQVRDTNQGENG